MSTWKNIFNKLLIRRLVKTHSISFKWGFWGKTGGKVSTTSPDKGSIFQFWRNFAENSGRDFGSFSNFGEILPGIFFKVPWSHSYTPMYGGDKGGYQKETGVHPRDGGPLSGTIWSGIRGGRTQNNQFRTSLPRFDWGPCCANNCLDHTTYI